MQEKMMYSHNIECNKLYLDLGGGHVPQCEQNVLEDQLSGIHFKVKNGYSVHKIHQFKAVMN